MNPPAGPRSTKALADLTHGDPTLEDAAKKTTIYACANLADHITILGNAYAEQLRLQKITDWLYRTLNRLLP